MPIEWNKTNSWDKDQVADFIRTYSDGLIRYAFCSIQNIEVSEQIVLDVIADFAYRNTKRALSKSYLYKMLYHRCVDHLRRRKNLVSLSDVSDVVCTDADPQDSVEKVERKELLYKCLGRLVKDYSTVLYLQYFEDFTIDEICASMGKTTKQVYNLISRAKVALKNELIKEGFNYEDL